MDSNSPRSSNKETELNEMQDVERPTPRTPGMSDELWKRVQEKALYPIQVVFRDLHFSVEVKKPTNEKNIFKQPKKVKVWQEILKGIDGVVNPGELLAIMGSSGAGKTTLLNTLAGRSYGKTEGEVLFNGNTRKQASSELRKHQAYVMQDDLLLKTQTPEEILTFSALLRLPNTFTREQKLKRVEDVIEELNIQNCRKTRVGAPGVARGISGGERKRVSVGTELIINPSLLFVDEPTTGLDSFTAENLMKTLRDLARGGRTVICTIHQPNSDIFKLFDKLLLLAAGETVYFGPADRAVKYFKGIGYRCPIHVNPADYLIKLIHIDQKDEQSFQRIKQFSLQYKDSAMAEKQKSAEISHVPIEAKKEKHHGYAQSTVTQFMLLTKRGIVDYVREPLKIRASLGQTIILSLLIGFIYFQIDNDQPSIQDRLGALFFIVVNQSMSSIVSLVNLFPSEKPIFLRETANNMYRPTAFYIAKTLGDLPFQILYPALFSIITYWLIGFQSNAGNFFIFLITILLTANVAASLGLVIGILAKDANIAIALTPVTILPFMIFSGFFVNSETLPAYLGWIEYISFIKYGFEAVVTNEFEDLTFSCPPSQICRVTNGNQQLTLLGMDLGIVTCLAVLAGMYVFWRLVGWIALIWKVRSLKSNA